jgi:hypothetical protein
MRKLNEKLKDWVYWIIAIAIILILAYIKIKLSFLVGDNLKCPCRLMEYDARFSTWKCRFISWFMSD